MRLLAPGHVAVSGTSRRASPVARTRRQKAAQLAALPPARADLHDHRRTRGAVESHPGTVPIGPRTDGPWRRFRSRHPTPGELRRVDAVRLDRRHRRSGPSYHAWCGRAIAASSGMAQGLSDWAIPSAALLPGNNVFTVTAEYEGLPSFSTRSRQSRGDRLCGAGRIDGRRSSRPTADRQSQRCPVEATVRLLTERRRHLARRPVPAAEFAPDD